MHWRYFHLPSKTLWEKRPLETPWHCFFAVPMCRRKMGWLGDSSHRMIEISMEVCFLWLKPETCSSYDSYLSFFQQSDLVWCRLGCMVFMLSMGKQIISYKHLRTFVLQRQLISTMILTFHLLSRYLKWTDTIWTQAAVLTIHAYFENPIESSVKGLMSGQSAGVSNILRSTQANLVMAWSICMHLLLPYWPREMEMIRFD